MVGGGEEGEGLGGVLGKSLCLLDLSDNLFRFVRITCKYTCGRYMCLAWWIYVCLCVDGGHF